MTSPEFPPGDGPGLPPDLLSIGELAERSGTAIATLRAWESRHGFPVPRRLPSGHRRYDAETVDAVRDVQTRRARGVRLDVAIADVLAAGYEERPQAPGHPSVFGEMRRAHPHLPVNRLRKSTMLALTWAMEDEFCLTGAGAALYAAFQHGDRLAQAGGRWDVLAGVAGAAYALADFPDHDTAVPGSPALVPLDPHHPMLREWALVADSETLPMALSAWEPPGQDDVPDMDRVFESVWTLEPAAVRDAARVCAGVASDAGLVPSADEVARLRSRPAHGPDLRSATALFARVVSYLDRVAG